MIKQKLAIIAAAVALAASVTTSQAVLSLNYNSIPGTSIQFGPGSQFSFNPTVGSAATPLFQITTVSGGTGAAQGLFGWINGGPWTIGAVSIVGPIESAAVSGGGTLNIRDAGGNLLTGNINWVQIQTIGSVGGVNANLNVNISGLTYAGVNADLVTLANGKAGSINLSFQFNPGLTLTQLTTLGQSTAATSFSGSITSIPEPSTVVAGALLLLPFGVSTLRILRKNRAS